jgi:hypothetical protein
MRNNHKTGALFVLITLLNLSLCSCKDQKPDIHTLIRKITSLNNELFFNRSISILSRDDNDTRIIVTHSSDFELGSILLKINDNCEVFDINRSNWKGAYFKDRDSLNQIGLAFCELEIMGLEIDSCGNTYFTINDQDNYQFVLVKDKNCLDPTMNYKKFRGRCFEIVQ